MKKSLLLITMIMAVLAVQAQQKTIDRLFPDFAKDQERAKAQSSKLSQLPKEAKATAQDINKMLFPDGEMPRNTAGTARKTSTPQSVAPKGQQIPSSISATEAAKEIEASQASAHKKIVPPPMDQGEEPAPAKTTAPVKKTTTPANQTAPRNVNVKKQ